MKKIISILLGALLYFASPAIAIILLEWCIYRDLDFVLQLIDGKRDIYTLTYMISLIAQTLIVSIVNNLYVTVILTQFIAAAIGTITFYKIQFLNEPLLPWDIYLVNQVFDLLPTLSNSINLKLVILVTVIVIVLIIVLIKFTRFNLMSWKKRLLLFVATIIPLFMLGNYEKNYWLPLFKEIKISDTPWKQTLSLQYNGFIINFISKIPDLKVEEPEVYTKKSVTSIAESIEPTPTHEVSDLKPNIVIIMSEAFWELERMIGQTGEESLYPTVMENKVGQTISGRFGGGTSNVEFEAITGYSLNFLPAGTVPYLQFIKGDVPSLPRYLKTQGYATTALHTYHKYYWRRLVAYPSLGFDKFVGLEDLENPKMFGSYVDDEVINDLILDELKAQEKPQFIYAVTMQNHSMYDNNRYGENTLKLTDQYSDKSNTIINTYGTGIAHSDQKLKELFESLEQLDEPTLVVFFGDHLPYLDKTYVDTGYLASADSKTLEEELKMKETPLVAWNNYGKEISNLGSISTAFLAPNVLDWAELEKPKYYQFIEQFSEKLPGYTSLVKMDYNGDLMLDTPDEYKELEEQYRTLQYDLLMGKRYTEDLLMKVDTQK